MKLLITSIYDPAKTSTKASELPLKHSFIALAVIAVSMMLFFGLFIVENKPNTEVSITGFLAGSLVTMMVLGLWTYVFALIFHIPSFIVMRKELSEVKRISAAGRITKSFKALCFSQIPICIAVIFIPYTYEELFGSSEFLIIVSIAVGLSYTFMYYYQAAKASYNASGIQALKISIIMVLSLSAATYLF